MSKQKRSGNDLQENLGAKALPVSWKLVNQGRVEIKRSLDRRSEVTKGGMVGSAWKRRNRLHKFTIFDVPQRKGLDD